MDEWEEVQGRLIASIVTENGERADQASREIVNSIERILTGERSGRVYGRPGGGTYQASAPGEPPAERTGALRNAWIAAPDRIQTSDGYEFVAAAMPIGMLAPYWNRFDPALAGYISSNIAPRPFVEAVLQDVMPKIEAIFSGNFSFGGD